jgi:hypothetical protein
MPVHKVRSAASTILFLFLAGCSTSSGGSVSHLSWTKTTSSGKPVLLSDHYQVDPNCTFLTPPPVQIVSGPAHGTTRIELAKVYPSFKPDNVRYKCNSVQGNGIRVYYTPSPGFKGDDQVVVRSDFGGGETNEITVGITVK